MTKAKLHPVMRGMRGKMGDMVFKRWNGRTIVAEAPDTEGRVWTPEQLAHRERFSKAVDYGQAALADPALRAIYEAVHAATKQPLFSLTVEDYLTPPSVDEIDLSAYHGQPGDTILIRAQDDIRPRAWPACRHSGASGRGREPGSPSANCPFPAIGSP